MARYDSLSQQIVLVAYNGWCPQLIDIILVFHYGNLQEEIYIKLPKGYKNENKVICLYNGIYRLK